MTYESEFRIKEKEFYPRKYFTHDKVIEELANIVKEADSEIVDLRSEVHSLESTLDINARVTESVIDKYDALKIKCVIFTVLSVSCLFLVAIIP